MKIKSHFKQGKQLFLSELLPFLILLSLFLVIDLYALQLVSKNGHIDKAVKLDKAISSYQSADFETATQLLQEIEKEGSVIRAERRKALWMLGKCYVAQNDFVEAKDAIRHLLDLEPPLFQPDFDKESPKLLRLYYEVRKEKTGHSKIEPSDPGVQTIAIVDFKNRSFINASEKYNSMEKGFAEIMMFSLLGTTALKVVERDRVQWLMDEQNIQSKHNMEGAVRAGKLLGVHVVLMGSFILQDNHKVFLNARLVKVETGEILLHEAEEGKFKNFLKITRNLAKKITNTIDVKGIPVARAEVPNSLDAFLAYSDGLVFLDKEMYNEAYEKFAQALHIDPGFNRAFKAQERIKVFTTNYAQLQK